MEKVTLAFSRDHTISTVAIRLQTWSPWSHVGIVIPNEYGLDWVIEARAKTGVHRITLDQFMRDASKYDLKDVEVPNAAAAYEFARAQIGKKYDYSAIVGFLFDREWQKDDCWFCSELVEAAILAGGRKRFSTGTNRITPQLCWMVE